MGVIMTLTTTSNNLPDEFNHEQIDLIKNQICKGASDDELKLFIQVCKKTGLDPFSKQIYSIPRGNVRTIQTSIDGFRLIAERTGRYTPGREPTYSYDKNGNLISATSYIKKQTKDGTWHEVAATAYFSEYNGNNSFWKKMPHLMLAKCAESLALRKAFPAEMSGLYGEEEMHQADAEIKPVVPSNPPPIPKKAKVITEKQADDLNMLLSECELSHQEKVYGYMKANKITFLNMPIELYEEIYADSILAREKHLNSTQLQPEEIPGL